MGMQEKVDASVLATSGEDNRITVRVLAIREGDRSIRLYQVDTEERIRYVSAVSREQAEKINAMAEGFDDLQECWDHRSDEEEGVFEIVCWSEEDETTDCCDVVGNVDMSVPWMYAGTLEDRKHSLYEEAEKELRADGVIDEDDEVSW